METAIILAGGKGTRMLPLTEKVPKVLIEVNGRPFLYYVLENLRKSGYERFGVVAGYKKDQIKEFLKTGKYQAEIIEQPEALGTADAVYKAKDFVGQNNFTVLNGDNLISAEDLKNMIENDGKMHVAGYRVEDPSKYGVFIIEGDRLIKIVEKPQEYVGDMINTGLYRFTPKIFNYIDKIGKSARGEFEIVDAITLAARDGEVKVKKISLFWKDFGCKEDIPKMEEFIREEQLVLSCQRT